MSFIPTQSSPMECTKIQFHKIFFQSKHENLLPLYLFLQGCTQDLVCVKPILYHRAAPSAPFVRFKLTALDRGNTKFNSM